MSDGFYLDNDVIIKTCAYGVGVDLIDLSTSENLAPAILALARFTLRSRIKRAKSLVDMFGASDQLDLVLARVRLLEPTMEEIEVAADFEAAATAANLSFDTGESQLVAMLMARKGLAFISGDKRAALALHTVVPELKNCLICLEQVLHLMVTKFGIDPLRPAICRETASDRAVANCFQCRSQSVGTPEILDALESYSNDLRSQTGQLLVGSTDLLVSKIS